MDSEKRLEAIHKTVSSNAEAVARFEGTLDSIRNQTGDQWSQIRDLQEQSTTTATLLSGGIQTLDKLERRIEKNEEQVNEYKGDRKVVKFLAWIIGIMGLSGVGAFAKFFADKA